MEANELFFNPHPHQKLRQMLSVATVLHLLILIGLDFVPNSTLGLRKMLATLLEVSPENQSNYKIPEIALNIAPHAHQDWNLVESYNEPMEPHAAKPKAPSLMELPNLDAPPATLEIAENTPHGTVAHQEWQKRTISAAAHQSRDAQYLANWQSYMEQFGNAHYPPQALAQNLQGQLRLLVAIRQDGQLHEVTLLHSSGSPLLDQAAIDLVKQAAPFDPLPADIAVDTEILEIIRTWQFQGDSAFSAD